MMKQEMPSEKEAEGGVGGEKRGRRNVWDANWGSLNDPKNYRAIISTLKLILLF